MNSHHSQHVVTLDEISIEHIHREDIQQEEQSRRPRKDWYDRFRPFALGYICLVLVAVVLIEVRAVRQPGTNGGASGSTPLVSSDSVTPSTAISPRADGAIPLRLPADAANTTLPPTPTVQPTRESVSIIPNPSLTPEPRPLSATVSPLIVNTQGEVAFAQGNAQGLAIGPDGALSLIPAIDDDFNAPALDSAQWQVVPWGNGGQATIRDGSVSVNAAAIRSRRTFVHRTIEARMRFTAGTQPFQNLAWSADLNGATAILIGKPQADPSHLYARVKHEGEADKFVQLPVSLESAEYHIYGIEWGTERVDFTMDGVVRATIPIAIDTPMFAWLSSAGGQPLTADWARVLDFGSITGTFTAQPIDAGMQAVWHTIAVHGTVPTGTFIHIQTRTSGDGTTWSAYAPVDDHGNVGNAPGRYLQYIIDIGGTVTSSPNLVALALTVSPHDMAP